MTLCRWTSITPGQVKVVGKLLHTMPWTNSSTYPHVCTATTHESGRMIISKSVIIVFCQRVHGQVKYERRPSASCFTPCPGQTRSPNQMLRTASTQAERQDEREQNKITQVDSHDTWASELSKEAVGANKVLCWLPDAFVRCQPRDDLKTASSGQLL